jgi:hypothetical protein
MQTSSLELDVLFKENSPVMQLNHYSDGLLAGWVRLNSWKRLEIFLSSAVSRLFLEPTQLPVQWVLGAFSLGLKQPGHEANHSPPSSAEVKCTVRCGVHTGMTVKLTVIKDVMQCNLWIKRVFQRNDV